MLDLVVKGNLVTPAGVIRGGYLSVAAGKVVGTSANDPGTAHERLFFEDAFVFPGAIDAQVHSRSQKNREDFKFSTKAAAAGGVTTIVDMPYDEGLLVCDRESVESKASDIASQAHVDVALYGTIRPSDGVSKIPEQVDAGVCAFKFSTFGTDPERFPRISPLLMSQAFSEVAKSGLASGVHNENEEIVKKLITQMKASGRTDYLAHGETHTPLSELLAIAEIYEIGAFTGCRAHVVHCSLGRGIEICETYKRQGFDCSVEVCIHYLMFDEDNTVRQKIGLAKGNPPIRAQPERESLWKFLTAGAIDIVSTDHVAWSLDRKNNPDMLANASGGPSLEVLVPALIKGCVDRDVDLAVAARVLALNPARHFRLTSKGALQTGCDADFSIIDPTLAPWRVASSQTVSDWSLYDEMWLPQIKQTYLRGRPIWDGKNVVNEPGAGRFVKPFAW
ncbi:allantoinase [Pararhizobium capsulatum DSM 1112]|uniref:Allantoinase n=1 Tax=Pararhizobium capsulatum DSM 1112 TaxID=1121113 RepID=A0ABU0C076_9HYPH|nr:amidohydrolase family protein [Pararhizobium capsulatum]MDQ0323890.1 allantoinase [Pararhizobium capsulatum DSM 1112]